jgi:putative hemolysin
MNGKRKPAIFIIALCIAASISAVTAEENSSPPEGMLIGMPDPSAVWAEQQGYQYFTRTNPDGSQYGVTILPDGLEYDAWDFYRQTLTQSQQQEPTMIGMPDPSAVWAEQQGYQYFTRTNPDGSQYGVTILPDGLEYDAWDLFRTSRIF